MLIFPLYSGPQFHFILFDAPIQAAVNMFDDNQATPLALAAQEGHSGAVELMIKKFGADFTMVDEFGRTAVHLAAAMGHTSV